MARFVRTLYFFSLSPIDELRKSETFLLVTAFLSNRDVDAHFVVKHQFFFINVSTNMVNMVMINCNSI